MLAYVIRRLWQMIPTMLGVVLFIFILFNWVGGDPAYILAGKMSNPEQIENIRKQLGVDQPYYVQLWIFIKQILTFDYGASWSTGEPVGKAGSYAIQGLGSIFVESIQGSYSGVVGLPIAETCRLLRHFKVPIWQSLSV